MKKLLLITFLFIAFQAKSQTKKPIDSFLGIKFGSSYADVSAELKRQGGIVESESFSKQDHMLYKNLSLNNRQAAFTFVHFTENKAYTAGFMFKQEDGISIIDLSKKVMSEIEKTYGPSLETSKKFSPPFVEGDGHELEAIDSGKGEYNTYWLSGNNIIQEVVHKGEIVVMFIDTELAKLASANDANKPNK